MKYHLRIVFINSASNRVKSATVTDSITLTATGVRMTTGSFVSGPIALAGAEIQAWVQYSDPGVLDIEVLQNDEWVSAALVREGDSQTPDGTACKERTYSLILTKAVDSVQVRVNLNSESECYVYGYGVMAL